MYEDVAEQLADLGDRRAVGNVIHHAHEGEIPNEALAALEKAWRENGWWAEVQEGLETLRRGPNRPGRRGCGHRPSLPPRGTRRGAEPPGGASADREDPLNPTTGP